MQITAEMIEKARSLGEHDHCEICKDKGLIPCPDHKLELDADGDMWCIGRCDSGFDEPQLTNCYCQAD